MDLSEDGTWSPVGAIEAANQLHSAIMDAVGASSTGGRLIHGLREIGHMRVATRSIRNTEIDYFASIDASPELNSTMNLVLVIIRAEIKPPESENDPTLADILSNEMQEWVRLILGDSWYDYTYRVDTSRSLVRLSPIFYVVFISLDNRPELAPPTFDWSIVNRNSGPANRVKLRPKGNNVELNSHLLRFGDTHAIADTRAIENEGNFITPDYIWWSVAASRLLTLAARRAQQNAIDQLEITSISLDTDSASVAWRRNILQGNEGSTRDVKLLNLTLSGFRSYLREVYNDSSPDRAAAMLLNSIVHTEEFCMPTTFAQIENV